MKTFLALVVGFGASLGMFAGGLALGVYLLAVEPERQPGPSLDVADLWTAEPRKVDTDTQKLERLPAEVPAGPQPPAETATAADPAPSAVDSIATSSVEARAGEEPAPPGLSDELPAAHLAWCAERYRSYRPADDSYTSYSGVDMPCISPFSGDMAASGSAPSWVAESYPELLEEPTLQYASDGQAAHISDDHASDCFARYRSYRPEDNTYQPYGGGPRQQCR
ncbi:MAG: BA14K family protein [Pseudomonadota bacterium]|nr:BA14K family protein [Pseudomonadota bacterium]